MSETRTRAARTLRGTMSAVLLSLRQPSIAVFVPVTFTALAGSMVAASVHQLIVEPSLGVAVGAVVSIAIAGFVLSLFRVAWTSGEHLVIAGLFGRDRLSRDDTALGIDVKTNTKSIEYEVYATDGGKRAVFFAAWSRWGANRALRRLERTFELADDAGGLGTTRSAARAEVARATEIQEAQHAHAKAQIDAYYQKGGTAKVFIALFAFIALYVVGMAVYLALQ